MTRVYMHNRHIFLPVLVALVLAALFGCSPTLRYQRIPAEALPAAVKPPPRGLLRFEIPVTLKQTLWKKDSLFLTYSDGLKDYHGRVSAEDQVNLSIHQEWFPVYQVNPLEESSYGQAATGAKVLRHLDRQHWTTLVQRIDKALMDGIQPGTGILINVRDEEAFFYRRHDGSPAECPLMEKPADIQLAENHRLEAKTDGLFRFMTAYLETIDVDDHPVPDRPVQSAAGQPDQPLVHRGSH